MTNLINTSVLGVGLRLVNAIICKFNFSFNWITLLVKLIRRKN